MWCRVSMRVLIVPMAAMAETSGPFSRCRLIAKGLKAANMDIATCIAEDVNYKVIDGIKNYRLEVPMPFGLPKFIASKSFPIAQKLGITSRKTVNSFDQVLLFTGNLDYNYLKTSVSTIANVIKEYRPDIVYSEFNISAIIAAKKEKVKLFTTVSYPTQHEYAHDSRLTKNLNRLLCELDLPRVESVLQLFDWADVSFCPSIKELEDIDKPNLFYCGALKDKPKDFHLSNANRDKIVIYMGNGTISANAVFKVAKEAFAGYDVYIASSYLKEGDYRNVHVAPRWNFDELLLEAGVFINHGGQNSVVDGLIYGVPEIVVPGKVFERIFNASGVESNKAGVMLNYKDFNSNTVRAAFERIVNSGEMKDNAKKLGEKLINAGGVNVIINKIKDMNAEL